MGKGKGRRSGISDKKKLPTDSIRKTQTQKDTPKSVPKEFDPYDEPLELPARGRIMIRGANSETYPRFSPKKKDVK